VRLLRAARPIDQVVADPETEPSVREALVQVEPALAFARRLGLAVGRQYRSYAPWPGDRVVTTVVATRPGEIEPAGFWFPITGRVPYKGFFDPGRAEREADALRARGLDVCVVPVPAYSTLGWLADPVTAPMLRSGAGAFIETLLHELVHATLFAKGDADFNEGVATFVGQEAAVRFFAETSDAESAERERDRVEDERALARALGALRDRIAALYSAGSSAQAPRRAALTDQARAELAALRLRTSAGAAAAVSARLNDACLALAGTYERDLEDYAARLAGLDGDLARFVAEARRAARGDDPRAALTGSGTR
jgi:predicted aminopeptidase